MTEPKKYHLMLVTESDKDIPLFVCGNIGNRFTFTHIKCDGHKFELDSARRRIREAHNLGMELVRVN